MTLINIQNLIDEKTTALETELTSLRAAVAGHQNELKALNDQIGVLAASNSKLTSDLATAQQTVAAKNATIADLNKQINELKAEIERLKNQNPAPEPEPEPEQPSSEYPNESNTGAKTAGVTFTTISGTHRPKANTVYKNLKLTEAWLDGVKNVTYENCIFTSSSFQAINGQGNYSGLKLIDCTFNGQAKTKGSYAVTLSSDALVTRCNFYGWENAIATGSRNVIKDNYIHDLLVPGNEAHYDGISVQGGQDDVLIEHNTIIAWDTSAVFIKTDWGNINNIRVINNLIKNQSPSKKYAAAVYVYGKGNYANGKATNCQVKNNKCEVGHWGYYFSVEGNTAGLVMSGNVDVHTGANIDNK